MAVDLEELALKSIEQYAAFGVRLASIEAALVELNRKNEIKEEKFIIACDKLSRMEERLIVVGERQATFENNMSNLSEDLDNLAAIVRAQAEAIDKLTTKMQKHDDDHCKDCPNNKTIVNLGDRIEVLETPDKHRVEVCESLTSKWGLLYVRFITSKAGMLWLGATTANIILSFFVHYEVLKRFYEWIQFKN